jgi:hypothetical protein
VKIQLAKITRSRKGQPIRALTTIEAEAPSIGRGSQCAIHLSDPRVAFEHAYVFGSGKTPHVAGIGGAMLMVDGHTTGDLVLAPGSRFEIGPYAFTVEAPPPGHDVALAYELVRPLPDSLSGIVEKSRMSLADGGISKRSMAYTALAAMLVLFLLVPIVNPGIPFVGGKEAAAPKKAAKAADGGKAVPVGKVMSADVVWNPGPLAVVHQGDAYNCAACHEKPFVRVRDAACEHCHDKMPGHVKDAALQAKLFGSLRCAECHLDHRGGEVPIRTDAALCTDCHADIKRTFPQSTQANAGDFAKSHPEFQLTLWRGPRPQDVVRVKQSDKAKLVESSNLKFPHDDHLKTGILGPERRETLTCASCHAPDASGRGFEPISMKAHCMRCHELAFEPGNKERVVPHGSVEEAFLLIQEFYANISLGNIPVDTIDTGAVRRTIPMASDAIVTEAERQRRLKYARDKAQKVAVDLFEKRVCIVCHDVRRTDKPPEGSAVPWTVPPVRVSSAWMPKARFDHAKHGSKDAECKSCHSVERSHKSSDIAMPELDSCRTSGCHGGNRPSPGRVVSTCISCHGYHLADRNAIAAALTGAR